MRGVHPKVAAGGVAGAAVTALVWTASEFGVDLPAHVAGALVTLAAAASGWFKS